MAIVLVMLVSGLLGAVSAGTAAIARLDVLIAQRDSSQRELGYAARAALAVAIAEMRPLPDWTPVLDGRHVPSFSTAPASMAQMTVRLRAETGAPWVGFALSPVAALLDLPPGPVSIAIWTKDDGEDGDGDPGADANGCVMIRAEARGKTGGRAAVEAVVQRGSGGPMIRVWRKVR